MDEPVWNPSGALAAQREMYFVFEKMVGCAVNEQGQGILALDRSFENLAQQAYCDPSKDQNFRPYDMCRASCVMASALPDMRGIFVKDAQERFAKIEKPK